ncbi:MAG TPA: hypothetical protein VN764_06140, partial [Polyangiaceae bacterium]|nr:hypothetical protein [Polyangiaceae bacterium]
MKRYLLVSPLLFLVGCGSSDHTPESCTASSTEEGAIVLNCEGSEPVIVRESEADESACKAVVDDGQYVVTCPGQDPV